jgi:catechol 2,3-dioxygenase-like lactoylglutathione lyase family enzyme
MTIVSRLNVVFLYVSDVERSLRFYRDLLGIPLELHPDDAAWAEATLVGGTRFALHRAHEATDELGSGTVRLNFEVAGIDAAAERLRAAGVEVGAVERESWGSACVVADPDGYRIGLFEPPH